MKGLLCLLYSFRVLSSNRYRPRLAAFAHKTARQCHLFSSLMFQNLCLWLLKAASNGNHWLIFGRFAGPVTPCRPVDGPCPLACSELSVAGLPHSRSVAFSCCVPFSSLGLLGFVIRCPSG